MVNANISFFQINRFIKERRSLIIISALLFTGIYVFFVKFYQQSFALFYYEKPGYMIPFLEKTEYNIYRGGDVGIYFQIGNVITENNKREINVFGSKYEIDTQIIPHSEKSSGGYENVLKVLGDSRGQAFGLIQEEAYAGNEMIRNELNFVTPLYLERMHIIFRKPKNAKNSNYTISNNTDSLTLGFLARSKINLGSPNSGTHIMSRYVINELNDQIIQLNGKAGGQKLQTINDFSNIGGVKALDTLEANYVQIVCVVTGAPTKEITALLERKDEYGLIGIEPDFTAKLNNKHNINLNFTTFDKKYKHAEKVTTFGTFAYLITNKKTPPSDIYEVLRVLNDNKDQINADLKVDTSEITLPLYEFDFLGHYRNKSIGYKMSVGRNIFLYLIILFPSTVFLFHILTSLISISIKDKYHDKLVDLIDKHIPKNRLPSFISFAKLTQEFDYEELQFREYQMLKYTAVYNLLKENQNILDLYNYAERHKAQKENKKYKLLYRDYITAKRQFIGQLRVLDYGEIAKLIAILITCSDGVNKANLSKSISLFFTPLGQEEENEEKLVDLNLMYKIIDVNLDKKMIFEKHVPFMTSKLELVFRFYPFRKNRIIYCLLAILNKVEVKNSIREKQWYKEKFTQSSKYTLPFLKIDQVSIINRIVEGISNLLEMRTRVSEDFTNGQLTTKHYNFLFEKVDNIIGKLRRTLAHRLNQLAQKEPDNVDINKDLINLYFTSDYLTDIEYELLMKNFE